MDTELTRLLEAELKAATAPTADERAWWREVADEKRFEVVG